jgi:molybdate transport system ATP-binding protein
VTGADTRLRFAVADRGLDVDLVIAPGETVALVGPNGAGKSTVVEVAAGLVRPSAGDVVLAGTTVVRGGRVVVPAHRRRLGVAGQDPSLFPHLSVLDNVAFGPRASGLPRRAARDRAAAALDRVGAAALADRRATALSGGQAQRVAIARAVAADPAVLLLDEPTSALDVGAQAEVRAVLAGVLAGRSALLVTHDPLEAITLADRLVVLERGRVVEQGRVDAVLRRPRSAFGAAFSGLVLLSGTATASGVRLEDGTELAADDVDVPVGGPALAAYHPTAARFGDTGPLVRRVDRLEPRDGLVRVVAGEFVVDTTVAALTAAGVRVGAEVTLRLPSAEVTVYGH